MTSADEALKQIKALHDNKAVWPCWEAVLQILDELREDTYDVGFKDGEGSVRIND